MPEAQTPVLTATADDQNQADSRSWRKEVWAPIWLLAAHALFALLLNPMGTPVSANMNALLIQMVLIALMGVMMSQPLLCALWAAWAWPPVVWRVPLGVAACALLGLAAGAKKGDVQTPLLYEALLVAFLALLATARYVWGWKLIVTRASLPREEPLAPERFNTRYLLVWTTIVALLAALAGAIESASTSGPDRPIGTMLLSLALFSAMLLPIIAAGALVLGRTRRWLVSLIGLPLLIGGVSQGAAVVVVRIEPGGPPFAQAAAMMAAFVLGATVSMLLSALVLRGAGYRVIREPRPAVRNA